MAYSYNKTNWVNNTNPPINAENLNKIENELERLGNLDTFYPVGSIYQTTDNSFNPNNVWGGTWVKIEGKVLVGLDLNDLDFNTVGNTGGAKGAWYHRHKVNRFSYQVNRITSSSTYTVADVYQGEYSDYAGSTNNQLSADIANMPPYEVVVMWKRTA